jgi:hypothetical protein
MWGFIGVYLFFNFINSLNLLILIINMSILLFVLDLVINAIVAIDTLGLVVATRKSAQNVNPQEMQRVCFTWACFSVLQGFMCCSCGYLGYLLSLIAVGAKLWIGLPKLGGADKLQQMCCNGQLNHYFRAVCDTVKAKCCSSATPICGKSKDD